MDKTLVPAFGQNFGVKEGKIAVIAEGSITGEEPIDASKHVDSPGFIDGHTHVVDVPIGQRKLLRDEITTQLNLEVGGPAEQERSSRNEQTYSYGSFMGGLGDVERPGPEG